MSERFGKMNVNGEKVELTRENVSVFRHLGRYALYDHVFVQTGENEGVYVWAHNSSFEALCEAAAEALCVQHLNLPEVSEQDEKNYMRHALADMESIEGFPTEWESGTIESD